MNRARTLYHVAAVIACGSMAFAPAGAEDTKGKWQFGFGLSYYATTDYIRSNSDIAIANSLAGQAEGLPPVQSVDDRPDENMLNEPTVRDDFMLNFNASYGLTRWLAVELAAGYLKTSLGDIEYFVDDKTVFSGGGQGLTGTNLCGPNQNNTCFAYSTGEPASTRNNLFIPVGTMTEVPIQLSALVRFRPESPLDPYVGLGVGYILADLKTGSEFQFRAAQVSALTVTIASEGEFTNSLQADKTAPAPGFTPTPLQAEVNSGFEYHAVGGVDYFLNDHFSVFVDARYVWSDAGVNITTDGAHQVRLAAFQPGKLETFAVGSIGSPIHWEDRGIAGCPTCVGDELFATEDSNGNGTLEYTPGPGYTGVLEGYGILYLYPAGKDPTSNQSSQSFDDPSKAVTIIDCTGQPQSVCPWANNFGPDGPDSGNLPDPFFDTEDVNGNRILDRFLSYGVDVCTLPGADSNPICPANEIRTTPQYLWPEGCALTLPQSPSVLAEGCPRSPAASGGLTSAGADNTNDIYLIQGGQVRLGGFSLGVGVKFTF